MSYLNILMKTEPEEGSMLFKKQIQTIEVPITVKSSPDIHETHENSNNKKSYSSSDRTFKNKNALREDHKSYTDKKPYKKSDSNTLKEDKKTYKKSDSTAPREDKDPNYWVALNMGMDNLLIECKPIKEIDDLIDSSLGKVPDWRGEKVYVNLTEDSIVINLEGKDYTFSKLRFMGNRNFQTKVSEYYAKKYGNTFVKFFQRKSDLNTYTIHIMNAR